MKPIPYVVFYGCRHSVTRKFVAECIKAARNASIGTSVFRKKGHKGDGKGGIFVRYVYLTMEANMERIKFVYTK